jgi:anti-sigma B factor antagonist
MEINKTQEGSKLNIALIGRLDTVTSPQLQEVLDSSLNGITELVFDFAKLDYISSAGLRVLLATNKKMVKVGKMIIRNVNDVVQEVFDMTGFADILNIE